jgi:hypothetical protein
MPSSTLNNGQIAGNADNCRGDEVVGVQVGQMRVAGRLKALLRTLLATARGLVQNTTPQGFIMFNLKIWHDL